MNNLRSANIALHASLFTALVCVVACIGWGSMNAWQFSGLTLYTVFPLLGLIAFSILWSQYVVLTVTRYFKIKGSKLSAYFTVTGWIFLVAIFLHPGFLIWQLWRDGFGLPPESYLKHYVAPGLEWAALLGSISFLIFLSFELRRWYGDRQWWRYIVYATDAAALAIFVHSFKLGSTLQQGWFYYVWIFYGITLILMLLWLRIAPLLRKKD